MNETIEVTFKVQVKGVDAVVRLQQIADAWNNETHPVPTAWRETQAWVRRWMPELAVLLDALVEGNEE